MLLLLLAPPPGRPLLRSVCALPSPAPSVPLFSGYAARRPTLFSHLLRVHHHALLLGVLWSTPIRRLIIWSTSCESIKKHGSDIRKQSNTVLLHRNTSHTRVQANRVRKCGIVGEREDKSGTYVRAHTHARTHARRLSRRGFTGGHCSCAHPLPCPTLPPVPLMAPLRPRPLAPLAAPSPPSPPTRRCQRRLRKQMG